MNMHHPAGVDESVNCDRFHQLHRTNHKLSLGTNILFLSGQKTFQRCFIDFIEMRIGGIFTLPLPHILSSANLTAPLNTAGPRKIHIALFRPPPNKSSRG
ncbi:predicted protein [Botrytis cinerea T4]|uniref:Uncharacterized protein n=1 Tax=Botryotinia fuckeliana (strain T4) TaxID=999810 RepID=G2XX21_BOTF4|nr:predicted protein [Botrytis cinerea T4]